MSLNGQRFSSVNLSLILSMASGMSLGTISLVGCGSDSGVGANTTGGRPPAAARTGVASNAGNQEGSSAMLSSDKDGQAGDNAQNGSGGVEGGSDVEGQGQGETALDNSESTTANFTPDTAIDTTALPEVTVGNGRLIDGTCVGVCEDASTDPDVDGWGFENGESCVVSGGAPASGRVACDRLDLVQAEPAQPQIPEGNQIRPTEVLSTGFFVANGRLFDRFGNDFIMRGVNHPVAWYQNDALRWVDEIAETGANSVRLVWETDRGDTGILRQSIARAIELEMVPMIELHDVTGGTGVGQPAEMAQYFVNSLGDILDEFEDYLLVNIANEWGDFQTSDANYSQAYRGAIDVLRSAGVNHTLVIDGSNWGQNYRAVHNEGLGLLEYDAQHNLLFSIHMYESYENPQEMLDALNGAVQRGLPLIVGEFGFQHGNRGGLPITLPFEQMLAESERLGLGYLAWSWTGNSGGVEYLDLSIDGTSEQLSGWGDDLVNGLNGIRATAQPAGLFVR